LQLAKGDRLSDWSRRPLSRSQLEYAAADVAHLLALADAVSVELERRGRLRWAEEESALLVERPPFPPDPREAWWKLRDNRSLHGSSRGIAQEVAAWRELKARDQDVLPRSVLPDLAVLSIAHAPPRSLAALREVRGLDGRHLRGGADQEILSAVARGRALPAEMVRSPKAEQVSKRLRPAVALATAWVAQLSRDEGVEASLLATRADIVEWLSRRDGARLGRGWREGLVGEPLARLARGEAALAVDGEGNLLMEPRTGRSGQPAGGPS
jgi:ribonuclease D